MNLETKTKKELWMLAIRPKTLPAAVGPVLVGSAAALMDGHLRVLAILACFAGALLLQIAVNLANDYFDAKNSIDTEERLGPVRVTQSGLLPAVQVKWAMILTLFLGMLVFAYLTSLAGLPIFIVAIASLLGALGYSGGPYPLASNALGELFVFIFFGLVAVCATYFIIVGQLSWQVVIASTAPGFLITAIMVVNNLRDIETDTKAGKRTLAVILGREKTIAEYRILLAASYIAPLVLAYMRSDVWLLLAFLSLPLALRLQKEIGVTTGRDLNPFLARTAKLSLMHSLAFAVGMIL